MLVKHFSPLRHSWHLHTRAPNPAAGFTKLNAGFLNRAVRKTRNLIRLAAFFLPAAAQLLPTQSEAASALNSQTGLVVEHVTLLPMTRGVRALKDMTVTIQHGRITAIKRTARSRVPSGFQRVDGRGKWLMPSLVDMHTHLENDRLLRLYTRQPDLPDGVVNTADMLLPYIANGVLQIFDLSAMAETLSQAAQVESGNVQGPHIAMAAMIDGEPPILPLGLTRVAKTPAAGRQAVRDASKEGYGFIKVYSRLDLATFSAIVAEARKLNMPVIGHIPQRNQGLTGKFFQPGFGMVAHAEEFAQQTSEPSDANIGRYVSMAKRNGTWLVATLSLDERILEQVTDPESLKRRSEIRYLNPLLQSIVTEHNPYVAAASPSYVAHVQRIVDFNRKLVRAFARAGIPVLSGTDSPVPGVVPGYSLHDELEAMSQAGLSNEQVLVAATTQAAQWLGVSHDRGTVAVGKRANLLLLDANPLANIANTRRIAAVINRGVYLPKTELDQRMQELAGRFAAISAPTRTTP